MGSVSRGILYLTAKIDLITLSPEGKYGVFRYGCGERSTALNLDNFILYIGFRKAVTVWPSGFTVIYGKTDGFSVYIIYADCYNINRHYRNVR